MSNFYTTKYKLDLANSIIANFCGDKTQVGYNNSDLEAIHKIERKYNKSKGRYCDLSDFCIRLSEIPQVHYKLMISINWLNPTEAPKKSGFYKSASTDKQGITRLEHFITIDKYIQLLFIELNIRELYNTKH
ncbi:MAG: hypothetical protein K0R14_580 [Burkholderiales bacterium]|jgi:hypothetical protein|nr:hypothetical protein [Burkholderiales bacterium]